MQYWGKTLKTIKRVNFEVESSARESENLAKVHFAIDSCRLVSQSNYLNRLDCDWLILACLIRDSYTADATFTLLENKVWLVNARGNYWNLYYKTNKEASTCAVFCCKALRKRRALKKWGKTLDCVSCFPLHLFRALPLPACFTTEHSTVEASLLVNFRTEVIINTRLRY